MVNDLKSIFFAALVAFFVVYGLQAQDRPFLPIYSGMQISGDLLFIPGRYEVHPEEWRPIEVEGKNIDLNFNDAHLVGNTDSVLPPFYAQIAIICRNAENITIRNLRISRFKTAIVFENCKNIRLENCEISYMQRKPWMSEISTDSFFNMESLMQGEAAIDIKECNGVRIIDNYFNANQIGLRLTQCSAIAIHNNFFLFHSASAVDIEACAQTDIAHNRFDFNFSQPILTTEFHQTPTSSIKIANAFGQLSINNNGFSNGFSAITIDSSRDTALIACNAISQMLHKGMHLTDGEFICFDNTIDFCTAAFVFQNSSTVEANCNQISNTKIAFELPVLDKTSLLSLNKNIVFDSDTLFKLADYKQVKGRLSWSENRIACKVFASKSLPSSFFRNCTKNTWYVRTELSEYKKYKRAFCRKNDCSFEQVPNIKNLKSSITIDSMRTFKWPNQSVSNAMATTTGIYDQMTTADMKPADFGPYDYRYPFTYIESSDDYLEKIRLLGPPGTIYALENVAESTLYRRGSLPDYVDIKYLTNPSCQKWRLTLTGESIKWPNGQTSNPQDTIDVHFSNVINKVGYQLKCNTSSDGIIHRQFDTILLSLSDIPWNRISPVDNLQTTCKLQIQCPLEVLPGSFLIQSNLPVNLKEDAIYSLEKKEYEEGIWTKKVSLNEQSNLFPIEFSFKPKPKENYLGIHWLSIE